MANPLKQLLKDTALYGLSSIVGRFLNYLLVPLYTYRIAAESGGYGIVTNLYGYTALLLALLTFGMETTLFRFSNKEGENPDNVYGTTLRMVGGVCLAFLVLLLCLLKPVSEAMGYASHPEYIACMGLVVAMDAFQAIMFSRLRQQNRAVKFVMLKFAFIIPNILLNLAVFLALPRLFDSVPVLAEIWARFDNGVGLIFFINLVCTALVFIGFARELRGISYGFDKALARRMLSYTWPLLLLSLVGILNQVADKILFPYLLPGEEGRVQLGIYGACVKIAMIMAILTQAFRYAYEPIVFNGSRDRNNPRTLADGMKYYLIFTLLAYLAVMFYMPLLRHIIQPSYWAGLKVVPVVMAAEIFMGVYFNLSFWYKLTDRTLWGAVMSAIGAAVMILVNVVGVRMLAGSSQAYMACAWGGFAGYGVAMVLSWILGQRYYPVPYDYRAMAFYVVVAALMYAAHAALTSLCNLPTVATLAVGTIMLLGYMGLVYIGFRRSGKA